MEYKNFFRWLELTYRIDINNELRNTLTEHFGGKPKYLYRSRFV